MLSELIRYLANFLGIPWLSALLHRLNQGSSLSKRLTVSVFVFLLIGCTINFNVNVNIFAESRQKTGPTPKNAATTRTTRATITPTPHPQPKQCSQNVAIDINDPLHAVEMHPVSRLHEIQAKAHKKEPIFQIIGHRGEQNKNNQEFHVQVTVNDKTASAWAFTKKEAKRRAAIEMLNSMGSTVESDGSNNIC